MTEFNAEKTAEQMVSWIKNWFDHNPANHGCKAVIGISGGKDSAIVAAACVKALGKDRVFGVLLPDGDQETDSGMDVCIHLDIEYTLVDIGPIMDAFYKELEPTYSQNELNTVVTFNTPARIRMAMLYAISGQVNGRVANTCNWSEDYVGYATKYGDAAGDFSPLSDLTVTEVKQVGYALGLPEKFIEKTPADGLCGKSDEDALGFTYEVLDKYIRTGNIDCKDTQFKIEYLRAKGLHKLQPMPKFENPMLKGLLRFPLAGGGKEQV